MYVRNRYANYPNGNREAWPLQLADLFLLRFSCSTSQSLEKKHSEVWVVMLASLQLEIEYSFWQYDVNNTHTLGATIYNTGCL